MFSSEARQIRELKSQSAMMNADTMTQSSVLITHLPLTGPKETVCSWCSTLVFIALARVTYCLLLSGEGRTLKDNVLDLEPQQSISAICP